MRLYSTKRTVPEVSLKDAVCQGLPADNGLYMPVNIPQLPASFFDNLSSLDIREIGFEVTKALVEGEVPDHAVKNIVDDAINFDAPVVNIKDNLNVLELWHGPSLAFKDFGARFMSRLMAHFLQEDNQEMNILVATSGDTGSAVAQGFYNMPGIKVTILYPSNKVSKIQEQQLTTLGGNVTALEVKGTFDDCQKMVKEAFLDSDLNNAMKLTSANSINISRLIPQSFYYFSAVGQMQKAGKPVVFCVPSGNFGNLCGGLLAHKMGLPVAKFVAATNVNDVVPEYLESGVFSPRPSTQTISNAMDVGNPSNFPRMLELYNGDIEAMRREIVGSHYNDEQTREAIKAVYDETDYVMCPHTAVAYLGLSDYFKASGVDASGVFLSTAHPSKFTDTVEAVIGDKVDMPERLKTIVEQKKQSIMIENQFEALKSYLLD